MVSALITQIGHKAAVLVDFKSSFVNLSSKLDNAVHDYGFKLMFIEMFYLHWDIYLVLKLWFCGAAITV